MCAVINKISIFCTACLLILGTVTASAGVNPFKKAKSYNFGDDVPWYEHNGAAIKSGSVRNGSDTDYYHLNVDKYRLLLRLGRNDPSGELESTRLLDNLSIADVKVDGRRLPVFGWCLENQQNPGKKLKQNAVVANDICQNSGGGGDFIIQLDKKTRNLLKKTSSLVFVIEPYGRPVKLTYSMSGFAPIMAQIDKPAAPKVVRKAAPAHKAAVKPVSKPVAKPKPVKKPVKLCYARPPAEYKNTVSAVSFPCGDKARKSQAESRVAAGVQREKKRKQAELKAKQEEEYLRLQAAAKNKRQMEWESKQAEMWISRCQRHWKKGKSPCFCKKYIKKAPPGVVDTCDK